MLGVYLVMGRGRPHEQQCEVVCVLGKECQPVAVGRLACLARAEVAKP